MGARPLYEGVLQDRDHSFLVIASSEHPQAKSLNQMRTDPAGADAWVVEGWLGLAARYAQFPDRFFEKLTHYALIGKEIVYVWRPCRDQQGGGVPITFELSEFTREGKLFDSRELFFIPIQGMWD